jgi:hypothetical protein
MRARPVNPVRPARPFSSLQLDELTEVEVQIPSAAEDEESPVDLSAIDDMIGFIRNAPPDMAEHHDRYLYDQPRVIFLDTGFLFALISTKDEHHERVLEVFRKLKTDVYSEKLARIYWAAPDDEREAGDS